MIQSSFFKNKLNFKPNRRGGKMKVKRFLGLLVLGLGLVFWALGCGGGGGGGGEGDSRGGEEERTYHAPRITKLYIGSMIINNPGYPIPSDSPYPMKTNEKVQLGVEAYDEDGDVINYEWKILGFSGCDVDGCFTEDAPIHPNGIVYQAPSSVSQVNYPIDIQVTAIDPAHLFDARVISIIVNNEGVESKTLYIYSTKDVFVGSANPDHNYDYVNDTKYGKVLKLAPSDSFDGEYRIYVYFDLSQIPPGATIDEAKIKMLNCGGSLNNSSTVAICSTIMLSKYWLGSCLDFNHTTTSWSESDITWNSALNSAVTCYIEPGYTGWLFQITGPNGDLEVDVTYDVQAYIDGLASDYTGWVIVTHESSGSLYSEYKAFYSSDYSTGTRPVLSVTYH